MSSSPGSNLRHSHRHSISSERESQDLREKRFPSGERPITSTSGGTQALSSRETLPCRSLYIREIPKDVPDRMLVELFRKYEGFVTMRRMPYFTFVEFDSIDLATKAMKGLQGFRLRAEDLPLSVDYDKDFREKPDRKRKYSDSEGHRDEYPPSNKEKDFRRDETSDPTRRKGYQEQKRSFFNEDSRRRSEKASDGIHSNRRRESARSDRNFSPTMDHYGSSFMAHQAPPTIFSSTPDSWSTNFFRQAYPFPPSMVPPPMAPYSSAMAPPYMPMSMSHSNENPTHSLFISNLTPDVTEREISILFRFCPGFLGVRLVPREERSLCFLDFADTTLATAAMHTYQGYRIDPRSPPLLIEYNKHPPPLGTFDSKESEGTDGYHYGGHYRGSKNNSGGSRSSESQQNDADRDRDYRRRESPRKHHPNRHESKPKKI